MKYRRNRWDKRKLGIYRLKRKYKETGDHIHVGGFYFDEDKK